MRIKLWQYFLLVILALLTEHFYASKLHSFQYDQQTYLLEWKQVIKAWQVLAVIQLVSNEDTGPNIFGFHHTIWNNSEGKITVHQNYTYLPLTWSPVYNSLTYPVIGTVDIQLHRGILLNPVTWVNSSHAMHCMWCSGYTGISAQATRSRHAKSDMPEFGAKSPCPLWQHDAAIRHMQRITCDELPPGAGLLVLNSTTQKELCCFRRLAC